MLSDYCKKIADEYKIKVGDVEKLIPNLGNKTNYVLHYRNLQLYLSLGMKLTKIHRVLKFKQSDWMKKYIDFNTEKRTNAANSFEKDFFKLMINSVYGKTMENLRKRMNVRLANNEKDFLKYTSRPTHITHKIFDKNYVAIHEIKPVLTFNKPIYVGFTVLEINKWLMHDFHYNFIKKIDAKLLLTDTDSLTHKIKSEDDYDIFEGKIIDEFVGLKSKMHSMKHIDGKKSNTAKGVNIANEFNEFKDIFFNKKVVRHKMKRIQSKKHKIRTCEINKISLSCFDDKRFV